MSDYCSDKYITEDNGYTILQVPKAILDGAYFDCNFHIIVAADNKPVDCLLFYHTLCKDITEKIRASVEKKQRHNNLDLRWNRDTNSYERNIVKYVLNESGFVRDSTHTIGFLVISETELDLLSVYKEDELLTNVSGFLAKSYMLHTNGLVVRDNRIAQPGH
jgi:hypothetical protein